MAEQFIRMARGWSRHPKIVAAGGDAALLWAASIDYSKSYGTAGIISRKALPSLTDRRQPARLAAVLVAERLWHESGHDCPRCPQPPAGAYVIHDFGAEQDRASGVTRSAKGAGGSYGNHQRWHAGRGITDADCSFCASDKRSHMRSLTDGSTDRICDDPSGAEAITTDRICDAEANRISESLDPAEIPGPGLFPEVNTPPIVPPAGSDDRISDRSPDPSGHGKSKVRTARQAYDYAGDENFRRFWAAFPQKSGKPAAYKAWLSAMDRGADPEHVIAAARAYADDPQRDLRHTKYPQGWLNDERYNDTAVTPAACSNSPWDN